MTPEEEALHLAVRFRLAGARLGWRRVPSPYQDATFPAIMVARHYIGVLVDPESRRAEQDLRAARRWLAALEKVK